MTIEFYNDLRSKGILKESDIAPDVTFLEFYIDAYNELCSCSNGLTETVTIPWSAIKDYADFYALDFLMLKLIIRVIEKELAEHDRSKKQKNS